MATLADDFLKAAHLAPRGDAGDTYRYLAQLIGAAKRFKITPDARDAVKGILNSRPASLIHALDWARLPFPVVWMEWDTPIGPCAPGQYQSQRGGALLRQDGERLRMFTAWRLVHNEEAFALANQTSSLKLRPFLREIALLGVSAVEAAIDFNVIRHKPSIADPTEWYVIPTIFDDRAAVAKAAAAAPQGSPFRHALNNEEDFQALRRIEHAVLWRVHREAHGYDLITRHKDHGDLLIRDVKDDIGPMVGILIMMNCRNAVEITAVEPHVKLNKARVRRGQPALVDYSTIHVHLFRRASHASDGAGDGDGDGDHRALLRHDVRGHFKVRKTGVFYWRPHQRGSDAAGVVSSRTYQIDP